MRRRQWMQHAVAWAGWPGWIAAGAGAVSSRAAAQAADGAAPDARFLLVLLRGAVDGLNVLVPRAQGFYAEQRPTIAVPLAAEGRPGATALDADWALHPALAASVAPLAARGEAVFVPFAGLADRSRSHFETQDRLELGIDVDGPGAPPPGSAPPLARDFSTGFMNRLARQVAAPLPAIAFTDTLPLVLRGARPVGNVAPRQPAGALGGAPLQAAWQAMYDGHALAPQVATALAQRAEMARLQADERRLAAEMQAAGRGAPAPRGFEQDARRIGQLMRERYALGFVDLGGWDTHVNQGGTTGALADRLGELGRGLAALADALGPAWARTLVVVASEFGRTVRENGGRGTDHGHGNVAWVLGGGLRAGGRPVAGEQCVLNAANLFEQRDLPVLNDLRGLMGGLLARQFGLDAAAVDRVFPGARPLDLGLV